MEGLPLFKLSNIFPQPNETLFDATFIWSYWFPSLRCSVVTSLSTAWQRYVSWLIPGQLVASIKAQTLGIVQWSQRFPSYSFNCNNGTRTLSRRFYIVPAVPLCMIVQQQGPHLLRQLTRLYHSAPSKLIASSSSSLLIIVPSISYQVQVPFGGPK